MASSNSSSSNPPAGGGGTDSVAPPEIQVLPRPQSFLLSRGDSGSAVPIESQRNLLGTAGGAVPPKKVASAPSTPSRRQSSVEQLAVNVSAPAPTAPEVKYTPITIDPHRRLGVGGLPLPVTFDCLKRHNKKRAKVLVVITAYNETWDDLKGTLNGVLDNVGTLTGMRNYTAMLRGEGGGSSSSLDAAPQHPSLRTMSNSSVGSDGLGSGLGTMTVGDTVVKFDKRIQPCSDWLAPEELVVMVVFDGREKMSPSLFGSWDKDGCVLTEGHRKAMMEGAAAFQAARGPGGNVPADSDVRDLHMLEMQYRPEVVRTMQFATPINLIFAIKEKNGGKLNSHVWAFRGLAPFLQPRYLLLLDAGTTAGPSSILRLIADMEADESIGGCCGEIVVDYSQRSIWAPIIMAQAFEYVSANAIDKSFESVCGYIGVLPGAFSAYRFRAIMGAPLAAYFKLEEKNASSLLTPMIANMYLAEDRILGFEIVAQRGQAWRLRYNSLAPAVTDVPATVGVLVRQRRRWLNGSFFATLYTMRHWGRMLFGTHHGCCRKTAFFMLHLWNIINIFLNWFSIGNAYFALRLIFISTGVSIASKSQTFGAPPDENPGVNAACLPISDPKGAMETAFGVLIWIYQSVHILLFIWSLGNKPDESEGLWGFAAHTLGICNMTTVGLVLSQLKQFSPALLFTGVGALTSYVVCAFLQGQLLQLVSSIPHYMYMLPLFILLIPIYSMCNLHDVSWGNRPSAGHVSNEQAKMEREFREFRSRMVAVWLISNVFFCAFLNLLDMNPTMGGAPLGFSPLAWYGLFVCGLAGFSLSVRTFGVFVYVGIEWAKILGCMKVQSRASDVPAASPPGCCARCCCCCYSRRSGAGGGTQRRGGETPPPRGVSERGRTETDIAEMNENEWGASGAASPSSSVVPRDAPGVMPPSSNSNTASSRNNSQGSSPVNLNSIPAARTSIISSRSAFAEANANGSDFVRSENPMTAAALQTSFVVAGFAPGSSTIGSMGTITRATIARDGSVNLSPSFLTEVTSRRGIGTTTLAPRGGGSQQVDKSNSYFDGPQTVGGNRGVGVNRSVIISPHGRTVTEVPTFPFVRPRNRSGGLSSRENSDTGSRRYAVNVAGNSASAADGGGFLPSPPSFFR